ncbi:hypothetical protein J7E63_27080 [Bacillus sp. ISL-75]|nr:hypothetical protein [Bacillus sp. ISL-75]MBT2730494.1 hypothetical protein [Bacillus sp. ISL-75]
MKTPSLCYFTVGTGGREYRLVFFKFTHDLDIFTAQYKKSLKEYEN